MVDAYIDGKVHRLRPDQVVGKGGEADIYSLGPQQVLKLFKGPDHPDFEGQSEAKQAARARIEEHQQKLLAFPSGLPSRVIAPKSVAKDQRGRVIGYTMPFLQNGEVLLRYTQRSFRQNIPNEGMMQILRDLHDTVGGVHRAQVVIGDFNDLNVLVRGNESYLIDADSMQFGSYQCRLFTTRFVDPLLCTAGASSLQLAKKHNPNSDWYAFAVMLMQCFLYVDPYGGIYKPKDQKKAVLHNARPLHRITVFHSDVKYPKPAVPYGVLPDDLLDYFHRVFEKDERGIFPRKLLEAMRWTKCVGCNTEHARGVCPTCATVAPGALKQTVRFRGQVTATQLFHTHGTILQASVEQGKLLWLYHDNNMFRREDGTVVTQGSIDPRVQYRLQGSSTHFGKDGTVLTFHAGKAPERRVTEKVGLQSVFDSNAEHVYWLENGRLQRNEVVGPQHVGDVLTNQTRIWVGPAFGFGFYRAGQMSVAFVFGAKSRGINDSVKLPPIRGQLIEATCVFTKDRCWFLYSTQVSGDIKNHCVLIKVDGTVEAHAEAKQGDGTWLAQIHGGAAAAGFLLMPTDDGVVRVEADKGQIVMTKEFPDTEPFVDAGTRLFIGLNVLYAINRQTVVQLVIK